MFLDMVKITVGFMLLVVLVVSCMIGMGAVFDSYECSGFGRATGHVTKYEALNCYIEVDGKFVVWDEYKAAFVRRGQIDLEVE